MTEDPPRSAENTAQGTQDILNRTLNVFVKKEREIFHRRQLPYRTLRSFSTCLLANHTQTLEFGP